MSAVCPCCGREHCEVREYFMQATRTEPMRSLGFSGYCPECKVSFGVETPQLALVSR